MSMDELAELASRWGVEPAYIDAQGRRQASDPEAIHRIVAALAAGPRPLPSDGRSRTDTGERAYQADGSGRQWLLAVQLYGVTSARNWGHGDFTDLSALVDLAAECGAAGVGLNPLHALFPDRPEQASPYSPNSRLFLNPLYIDVTAAPGFSASIMTECAGEVTRLRATPLVDYAGVAGAKMHALRQCYRQFRERPEGDDDFALFRGERGTSLERFAAFETLRTKFNTCWWEWPDEWLQPSDAAVDKLRESNGTEIGFHEYVQWVADRQLAACQQRARERGCSIGLYVDLAVGVDPAGADAWSQQGTFLRGLSVGAPPDGLNTAGQDWGLTTYNPNCLVARDFGPFRDLLAAAMHHAGAIRLDHILGLNRVYVIPHGMAARHGAYLRFPLDEMLRVVAEESRRHRCIVIGEDLGTVPEGFREKLAEWGIWTYLVLLFERDHDGTFRTPDRYPANALATFATHDMATFAGWSSGQDLRVKREIDLDPGETEEERARARAALRAALERFRSCDDDVVAVARYLAATPSRLVAVAAEDILGVSDQTNVPGTVHQHSNWRWRLPVTIDEMRVQDRLRRVAAAFAQAGRS
jgi:4-alpha-glucanotransferase